jgi:hypothetical protein
MATFALRFSKKLSGKKHKRNLKSPDTIDLGSLLGYIDKEVQFIRKISKVNKTKLNTPFSIDY